MAISFYSLLFTVSPQNGTEPSERKTKVSSKRRRLKFSVSFETRRCFSFSVCLEIKRRRLVFSVQFLCSIFIMLRDDKNEVKAKP